MTEQDANDSKAPPDAAQPDRLRQMASVVGHEIRNPLAIISNSVYFIKAKLASSGIPLDPKLEKHLAIIEGEIRRGNTVIEEILDFSRNKELRRAAIPVNALVKDLAAYYKVPENIAVKAVTDPSEPRADIDMEAVAHASRYVLDNAVQAMPEGGTVTIEVSRRGDGVLVAFTDTGRGFTGGDWEKAFAPFYTTKPRGVGLGLTIARKFLEAHGGKAEGENVPGGARITFSLPAAK